MVNQNSVPKSIKLCIEYQFLQSIRHISQPTAIHVHLFDCAGIHMYYSLPIHVKFCTFQRLYNYKICKVIWSSVLWYTYYIFAYVSFQVCLV